MLFNRGKIQTGLLFQVDNKKLLHLVILNFFDIWSLQDYLNGSSKAKIMNINEFDKSKM